MEITQELLHELFEYKDGKLYRKLTRSSNSKAGTIAGTLGNHGYLQTFINSKYYLNHRIIFLLHYGYLPKYIDHINGDKTDNRVENLRPATLYQNNWNQKLSKSNTSGIKGVCWDKSRKKWKSQIRVQGIQKNLGRFEDLELAILVVEEARNKYHGDFANHG